MSYKEISVEDLKVMFDNDSDFTLLDVRTENEVLLSTISSSSIHIPMNEIPTKIDNIEKNKELIIYCKSGKRSAKVCEYLTKNDFPNVKNLKGGILAWSEKIDPTLLVY